MIYSPEKEQRNPSSHKYNGYLLPALHGSGIVFATFENTTIIPPPPRQKQKMANHCFQFLLGLRFVPREIENKGYAQFGGVTKRLY